jgi:hypothetical protein
MDEYKYHLYDGIIANFISNITYHAVNSNKKIYIYFNKEYKENKDFILKICTLAQDIYNFQIIICGNFLDFLKIRTKEKNRNIKFSFNKKESIQSKDLIKTVCSVCEIDDSILNTIYELYYKNN